MQKPSNTFYQKNKKRLWASVVAFLSIGARAERIFPAQISKVTKDTPIFKNPSKSSEVLGDAPASTPVLLRGYSPKKTWVLVEDEDGAQGWVPTARVEALPPEVLEDSPGAPTASTAGPGTPAKSDLENAEESRVKAFQPSKTYDVHFLGRFESQKGDAVGLVGALVSYSFYRASKGSGAFTRSELSAGFLRTPTSRDAWNLPIRYSIQSTDLTSSFLMGPDVGLTFARRSARSTEKYFGIGYFIGYKLTQFNNLRFRISYDLGKVSHFGYEGGVQWMFY